MKIVKALLLVIGLSPTLQAQTAAVGQGDKDPKQLTSDTLLVQDAAVPPPVAESVNEMLNYAKKFLGTPYRYSGNTPAGFDCSGFINYVMGNFGFNLPRSSYALAELGQTIKLADVRPGDLLFFKGRNVNSTTVGHVAMVVEVNEKEIRMIHASTSRGVIIENFKSSAYYVPRFLKAKRVNK